MQVKAKLGNPVLWPLALLLIAALLFVGLTSSALAGSGSGSGGGKDKAPTGKTNCKKKSNGNGKFSPKKKRCHKKKPGSGATNPPTVTPPAAAPPAAAPPVVTPPAVTPPAPPPPAVTTLAISPASFDFGTAAHGGFGACGADPDPDCPTNAFTVTNTGASTSGVPTVSIVEIHNPEIGGPAAFQVTASTCTAALAPGTTCSLTVKFAPNSNAGDEMFSSRLDVTASPGSIASSALSGMAS